MLWPSLQLGLQELSQTETANLCHFVTAIGKNLVNRAISVSEPRPRRPCVDTKLYVTIVIW